MAVQAIGQAVRREEDLRLLRGRGYNAGGMTELVKNTTHQDT